MSAIALPTGRGHGAALSILLVAAAMIGACSSAEHVADPAAAPSSDAQIGAQQGDGVAIDPGVTPPGASPDERTTASGPGAASSTPAAADGAASAPVRATEGLVVGPSRPTAPGDAALAIEATTLVSMTPGVAHWRVVAGDRVGTELIQERTATDQLGAELAERWSRAGGSVDRGETPLETHLLRTTPDGAIVMPATLTHRDRATSEFEPALLMAPPELRANKSADAGGAATPTTTTRVRMTVLEEDPPRRVKEKGSATRELRIVDRVAISTPLGDFDAIRVSIDFRAKLSMASVHEVATQYVVPGLGVVAEERREDVRAVGIFARTTEQTIVRLTR